MTDITSHSLDLEREKLLKGIHIPDREELIKGCFEYKAHEERDAMYQVATFLIHHFWEKPTQVTNG